MKIDLRLIEIRFELRALREHFNIIDKNINELVEYEKRNIEEKYKNNSSGDPDDLVGELELHYHNIEIMYPRVFWLPFIVSCHSVFEASISEIAGKLMENKKYGLNLDDLKGSLLERIQKYFEKGLEFDLYTNVDHKKKIRDLIFIRNIIAHTNGRVDLLDDTKKKKLQELEKSNCGIYDLMSQLVVERNFALTCLEVVEEFLTDLCDRYKRSDA